MEEKLDAEKLLEIIAENFLCVRRLPFKVISLWSYKEGDEKKKWVDSNGNPIESKREVISENLDLEYFQKTKPSKYCTDSPEVRFRNYQKCFPNGRKYLKETKTVKNGGWWYVKQVENTDSTIQFSRKYDEFFAPTLEGAVKLFLESKTDK